jgi:2-amino-4-hydroxy-6-hydroxymethyldihydropteridine diphosphokinase
MVYLSLGSNLGNREENLARANKALEAHGFSTAAVSSLYETSPQDVIDQPWFLNQCVGGSTQLSPEQLLAAIREIELSLGRDRGNTLVGGPRTLDVDVLIYGDLVSREPDLWIPHPRLLQRRFVLEPLLEIAPDLIHPQSGRPIRDYLAAVLDQPVRKLNPR